jgi:hypothetical protein
MQDHRADERTNLWVKGSAQYGPLRDACEALASDLLNLSTLTCRPKPWRRLIHSLRTALVGEGLIKGSTEATAARPLSRR